MRDDENLQKIIASFDLIHDDNMDLYRKAWE